MTLTISRDLEEKLVAKAAHRGKDPNVFVEELLSDALAWDDDADFEEAVAGVERGLADFEAGRYRPFSEFAAEQRKKYGLKP